MAGEAPSRFEVAGRIVAALGYAALCCADRLEVFGLADGLTAASPPLRAEPLGPAAQFLGSLDLQEQRTDLARAAESFAARRPRRGAVVVVSDLLDAGGFCRGLEILRWHGYWPRVAHVFDRREAEPFPVGDVELLDAETGRGRQATITPRMRRRDRGDLSPSSTRRCESIAASGAFPCANRLHRAGRRDSVALHSSPRHLGERSGVGAASLGTA